MQLVNQFYELMQPLDGDAILKHIERVAKTCYQTQHKITENSAQPFVQKLINSEHESVLEHYSFSVKFVCDRATANQLTRHRLASFAQESTRYVNYAKCAYNTNGNDIKFVKPIAFQDDDEESLLYFATGCEFAERLYQKNIKEGYNAQTARYSLPLSLATELVVTANLREWRHIFRLRVSREADLHIQFLLFQLLDELKNQVPVIFDDIAVGYELPDISAQRKIKP